MPKIGDSDSENNKDKSGDNTSAKIHSSLNSVIYFRTIRFTSFLIIQDNPIHKNSIPITIKPISVVYSGNNSNPTNNNIKSPKVNTIIIIKFIHLFTHLSNLKFTISFKFSHLYNFSISFNISSRKIFRCFRTIDSISFRIDTITPNVNPSNASANNTIYHAYSGNKNTNIAIIIARQINIIMGIGFSVDRNDKSSVDRNETDNLRKE